MADEIKISELEELTTPADDDLLVIVDQSESGSGIDKTKKIQAGNLGGGRALSDLTDVEITVPADDEVLTYDDGSWVNKPLPAPTVEALSLTSGTVTIDFAKDYLTHDIDGAVTYESTGLVGGRSVAIKIACDGTTRELAFPAGWIFLNVKPTEIEADKVAVLSLTSFGTVDGSVIAAYALEAE